MQLYKSRDFGAFFQDTFTFLKQNGKHYFKHFFIVNGVFLLIFAVLMYFFWNFYTELIFGGIAANDTAMVDDYLNDNFGLFIILFLALFVVAILAGLVSYSYTSIYLKLYNINGNTNFDTKAIVNSYKHNIGKLFLFLLCGILIGIPIMFVLGIVSFVLMITIVGILGLPIVLGAFMVFYTMTLMEYLEEKRGIWDSFGYAWSLLSSKFWAASGCVALFFVIAYILQNIVVMIPYMFGMVNLITTIDNPNQVDEVGASFMIIMLIVFFLSFILGTLLNQVVQINQGVIFYSLKEDKENINTIDVIDQIGAGE